MNPVWGALALIALLLPGLAWLAWTPAPRRDPAGAIAWTFGLGVSAWVALALVGFWLGVRAHAGWIVALALLFGGLAAAGWRRARSGDGSPAPAEGSLPRWLGWIAALAALFLLLAWRFYQARDLAFPAWVDSPQHALVLRAILERGAIPADLTPYLNVPFNYHPGFHLVTALVTGPLGLPLPDALLISGQAIGAVLPFAVYALGEALGGRRLGCGAAALAALATQMPAYYVSWGRYPLLLGMVLLPLAMAAAAQTTRAQPGRRFEPAARLALLTVGLLLTHYLAALLLALFLGMLALSELLSRRSLAGVLPLAAGAGAGLAIALPWVARTWLLARERVLVLPTLTAGQFQAHYTPDYLDYLWQVVGPARNHALLALAGVGLLLALGKGSARLRAFACWAALSAVFSTPFGFRLAPFNPDDVAITLFLPTALLAALALESLAQARIPAPPRAAWAAGQAIAGLALLGLAAWGAWETRAVVNPATVLVQPQERAALEWIAGNTAPDAVFLANTTPWAWGHYRGVDAAAWILPAAGRQTVLPPIPYTWGSAEDVARWNRLAAQASDLTACDAVFWDLAHAASATHLYLREGVGALQPAALVGCAGVREVYAAQGVHIYRLGL